MIKCVVAKMMSSETARVTVAKPTFKVVLLFPVIVCVVGESVDMIDAERMEVGMLVVRVGLIPALILIGETPPVLMESIASRKLPAPEFAEVVTFTVALRGLAPKLRYSKDPIQKNFLLRCQFIKLQKCDFLSEGQLKTSSPFVSVHA